MVWQRSDPPPSSAGGSRSGGGEVGDRWEAAARAMSEATKETTTGTKEPPPHPPPPPPPTGQAATKGTNEICINCSLSGHFAPRCPTIRCEKCNKLGHMAQLCQTLRPWECVPLMCGFQSPGQGFFYIPDMCAAKQSVEKTNNVVITVVEGVASVREIEHEFNAIFAKKPGKKKWKCTARSIGPAKFVMRFPNASEVERACCYGKRMPLMEGTVVVCITPWTASIGAKGIMEKAWVRVRNIPIEKRCIEHAAYVGALVGITLEVDETTIHKPEYVRILLGCREVERIPPSAEGMLGEQYYDFFYEVEKVVTLGADKNQSSIAVDSSASPSFPKKARTETYPAYSTGQGETSASMVGTYSSQNYDKRGQRLAAIAESEEEEESDEGNHTELLIETMAREHDTEKMTHCDLHSSEASKEKVQDGLEMEVITGSPTHDVDVHKGVWGILTPVPPSPLYLHYDDTTYGGVFPPLADYIAWPSLPHIVPLEEGSMEGGENCSTYTVESPCGSPIQDSMIYEEYAPRRQMQKLEKVEDVATNRMRKRDSEGLLKAEDKAKFQAGVKRLAHVAAALADRPFTRDRLLLDDRDGIQIG
ncbi:hypothetical protein ACQJBY_017803 [Aegilops geniculata]